jgi:hypothetical protein
MPDPSEFAPLASEAAEALDPAMRARDQDFNRSDDTLSDMRRRADDIARSGRARHRRAVRLDCAGIRGVQRV